MRIFLYIVIVVALTCLFQIIYRCCLQRQDQTERYRDLFENRK